MKSEMKSMIESFDWSQTSLGPQSGWPISLRTVVDVVLNSQMPMHLSWGKDLIQFYNDANRIVIGDQHPLIGKSARETWKEIHDVVHPLINKVLSGESLYFEDYVCYIRRNGVDEKCHFSMSMTPVRDDEGVVAGVLTTMVETTKEKNQMQELKNILMQAPVPLAILEGPDFFYSFANPAHEEMLGKQVQGKKILEAFSEEEVGHFLPILQKVYTEGEPFIIREQPLNFTDNSGKIINKWLDVGFYPYRDHRGIVKGLFGAAVDITNAMTAKLQIEKALKTRDEFISIASHEFKTPVSSLMLQFQMVERNIKRGIPVSEEYLKRMLNLSLRQVEGLARLINDLLDATRASNQRMTFKFEETDFSSLARDAVNHVEGYLKDHETLLYFEIEDDLKLTCDPFRIEQVMTNLLTNASKYGNYRPIFLKVFRQNDGIKIIVKDQGIGIHKENHDKIFDRFERGAVTKNFSGLGLGLFITKYIVDAHKGTIQVVSSPGHGSTFTVTLPKG